MEINLRSKSEHCPAPFNSAQLVPKGDNSFIKLICNVNQRRLEIDTFNMAKKTEMKKLAVSMNLRLFTCIFTPYSSF
jgi:hypothetical protein